MPTCRASSARGSITGPANHLARPHTRILAAFQYNPAIHENVLNAFRRERGLGKRRAIADAVEIEDHNVGCESRREPAAVIGHDLVRGDRGHAMDGGLEREYAELAHVAREH